MKCYQCSNNAMYQVGDQKIPLCLGCYTQVQQNIERNIQMMREEVNFATDSINSMFGLNTGPRYPIKRPVLVSGGTVNNNHIAITNSQVGVLNTGNISSLNQTIDSLYSASQKELAEKVKVFSEAVLRENDLNDEQKTQILESLNSVTSELLQKPENRKKSVASILLNSISSVVQFAANSFTVWQHLYPLLAAFFK